MLYDIKLRLHYDYDAAVGGGRHLIRVVPQTLPTQRVIASSLSINPPATERSDFSDFFQNHVTAISYRDEHDALDIRMTARVSVNRPAADINLSIAYGALAQDMASAWSMAPDAPHHFMASSDYAGIDGAITAYARLSLDAGDSVEAVANDLCNRIYRDFLYDGKATSVATIAREAFRLKRGVCQDFSHIMIAGLRGLGIPAGYVSGFLRTIPPPGKVRLEGADAMHAWVRVWCGRAAGWLEFDPTNKMRASNDHITVGYGRDYGDVSPIVGILKTSGGQDAQQSVDVIPIVDSTKG